MGQLAKIGSGFSRGHILLLAVGASLAAICAWTSPAQAVETHSFISSFSSAELLTPYGIAVDDSASASAGDVYVVVPPAAPPKVIKFDADGNELSQIDNSDLAGCSGAAEFNNPFGVAVDPSNGEVYVSDFGANTVTAFDPAGTCLFQIDEGVSTPFGVTVDPSQGTNGTLYVASNGTHAIESFDAGNGAPISSFGSGPGTVFSIAVNSSGDLFAAGYNESVLEYDPSGNCLNGCAPIDTNGPVSVAVDRADDHLYVAGNSQITEYAPGGGSPLVAFGQGHVGGLPFGLSVNSTSGRIYVSDFYANTAEVFGPFVTLPDVTTGPATNPGQTSATLNGHVDLAGGAEVNGCRFEYGIDTSYGSGTIPCEPATPYPTGTDVTAHLGGLTSETTYHYRLVAENASGSTAGQDAVFTPHAVASVATAPATGITPNAAQLHGSFVGNGEDTHYYFEWGVDQSYGQTTPAPPGVDAGSAVGPTPATSGISGLEPITTYHYRLAASNALGTTYGEDESFTTPPAAPLLSGESVTDVRVSGATLHAEINPGGGETGYRFEYATDEEFEASGTYGHSTPVPDGDAGSGLGFNAFSAQLGSLQPDTTYHYRVVAHNVTGTTSGPDRIFTTYSFSPVLDDTCANANARQQTGAALLLDCRAYELVSAADSAGYDVESDLVPGQTPYPGYPEAESPPRVLYAIHNGGIPGTDHPTNKGPDPYIATRGEGGWSTVYVGVPANNPFASAPFSSIPSGASSALGTFAFAAPGGCSPCFEGGYTGIPVRLPNGRLVQGMDGPLNPGPGAKPDGYVARDLSADGRHLIFGSTSRFAEGGNSGGDVSIYDRDLLTGETRVISNDPGGNPLACLQGAGNCHSPGDANGIAELDISSDGSHVLLAQKVATDADGNVYWHLYMNVGDSSKTIDLTPGATDGVLYDGMTSDGSKVFFTSVDQLSADTDSSADVYLAQISGSTATLSRISTGAGTGNSDLCEPVSNSNGAHWNTVGGAVNCGAVAIGGAGGIGTADGSAYFLSPEQLDGSGNGAQDQPNLYVAAPDAAPQFIATLDADDPAVLDAVKTAASRRTADFQVAPNGEFAVFGTTRPLQPGSENAGHTEIYRYAAATDALDCVSCNPTGEVITGNAKLAANGSSLTEDGRVFFQADEALVLRDVDQRKDVYEWEPEGVGSCEASNPNFFRIVSQCISLVSAGSSPIDSSLLGASSNSTDVYFFTHDSLAAQDRNGSVTKIYDARTDGGFFEVPAPPPCAASDECHGAGSRAPGPPDIRTTTTSPVGIPVPNCRAGFVKKRGRCVKKPRKAKRHHHKAHRHG